MIKPAAVNPKVRRMRIACRNRPVRRYNGPKANENEKSKVEAIAIALFAVKSE
jgi:hypothetical protein